MIEKLQATISVRDHHRGAEKPIVTLLEYGDFACSYCAAAYPVVGALLERFAGRLAFVFRHNPRGELHPGAHLAAEAAEAAALQGQFWPMHDLLFERRGPVSLEVVTDLARKLRLDLDRFLLDLEAPIVRARVREDQIGGLRSGVVGTPTFFIDGRHFRDKPDLETLSCAVQARLSRGNRLATS